MAAKNEDLPREGYRSDSVQAPARMRYRLRAASPLHLLSMAARKLRAARRRLQDSAIAALDRVVPKRADLWVFAVGSSKTWSGNLQALFERAQREPDLVPVVVAIDPECPGLSPEVASLTVPTRSWRGLWRVLRGKVLIVQYHCHDYAWRGVGRDNRVICNVWHGVHLKGLGRTDRSLSPRSLAYITSDADRYALICATSARHRASLAESFGVPAARIQLTGLPRNDWLLSLESELSAGPKAQQQQLLELLKGRRLVLYAPTFRDDGDGVFPFDEEQLRRMGAVLRARNAVLGVRGHINRRAAAVRSADMIGLGAQHFPEAQALLRNTEVLVTDYSGIWVDYLLLQRPLIAFCYDWEQYTRSRGLIYDYDDVFPGPIVKDFDAFLTALNHALCPRLEPAESELDRLRRERALRLFHEHIDARSSERVVGAIRRSIEAQSGRQS